MLSQLLISLAVLAAVASCGWLAADAVGALVAVLSTAAAWMAFDHGRAARAIHWLRSGATAPMPQLLGVWGEVVYRAHQQLRARTRDLAASDSRLQEFLAAIQASPNGVVLLDQLGRIEWCNRTSADHFGFDARRDLMQLIGNLVRDPAFVAYFQSGNYDRELVMISPASSASQPMKVAVQLHPYGEGRRLLLSRDVTAIDQAETMRRDFVANVSHEIRTPLTVLAGFVEALQTLALEPHEQTRYLGLMASQATRMQTLVNDLLTLSKLDGSPPPGRSDWVSLSDVLATCLHEAKALSGMLCADAPHQLMFGEALSLADQQRIELAGSRAELHSALSNLINNAVRYTPGGGQVGVSLLWLDDRLSITVHDTGPGIEAEHLPRLTERFYRVDRSRSRETGGTGLGLAIVKHVVHRHGGELQLSSQVGVGSRFAIVMPAERVRRSEVQERGLQSGQPGDRVSSQTSDQALAQRFDQTVQ
jgi:two-component system phosphate regulon sensor histidine kinase PhoR